MHREPPQIGKDALFERLEKGRAEGLTIATPNRRLAQALRAEFDARQAARGLQAWETADILPVGAVIERFWGDALYSEIHGGIPLRLSPAQEEALWEEIIRESRHAAGLLAPARAAGQCVDAWRLLHGWRLDRECFKGAGQDPRAFLEWIGEYERITRANGQTDGARLPDVVARVLHEPAIAKPCTLAISGFDVMAPQVRDFLTALKAAGTQLAEVAVPAVKASASRVALMEGRHEIECAARWARARLEVNAKARIAVVVPDLERQRARVERTFANVMRPGSALEPLPGTMPFNLSLGRPLAEYPLVHDALVALRFAIGRLPFTSASRLLRSPFIAHAEAEAGARARLDSYLRRRSGPTITPGALARLGASPRAPQAPQWLEILSRLARLRKAFAGRQSASHWAHAFSEALKAAGFPGERPLDSAEHQALKRWHDALSELTTLDRVLAPMSVRAALARLETVANALFQPETPDVPVQVLGVLESAGLQFDHLWVLGLDDESWPLPARPNPLLPVAEQRRAGIPQADPITSLELDRRLTQAWLGAANEVVLSHALRRRESELAASPLIAGVAEVAAEHLAIPESVSLRAAIHSARAIEIVDDARAPAAAPGAYSGGTGLFRDQATCPFRGFARRRLASQRLESPRPGLDARDRGTLAHKLFATLWEELRTRERLRETTGETRDALVAKCVDAALEDLRKHRFDALGPRFAELERARLVRLAHEWLAIEGNRGDFEVEAIEQKQPVTFGGVTVEGRLDRLDRLADGTYAVIDYKTGDCKVSSWLGERPDDPQLPMYALGGGREVSVVSFARLKAGRLGFVGLGRVPGVLPGVDVIEKNRSAAAKRYRNWEELLNRWRGVLETTGRGFAEGDARVDPRKREACKLCDQPMLCRIDERTPLGAAADEGPADE